VATSDGKKTGGRKKGTPNKLTGDLKAMIMTAVERAGGVDYLERMAVENSSAFLALLGKVLPKDIDARVQGNLSVAVVSEFAE
jgi:hypothetical protein